MNTLETINNYLDSPHLVYVDQDFRVRSTSAFNRLGRCIKSVFIGREAAYADCKSERVAFAVKQFLSQKKIAPSNSWNAIRFLRQLGDRVKKLENQTILQKTASEAAQHMLAPEKKFLDEVMGYVQNTLEDSDDRQNLVAVFERRKKQMQEGIPPSSHFWNNVSKLILSCVNHHLDQKNLSPAVAWKSIGFLRNMAAWVGGSNRERLERAAGRAAERLLAPEHRFLDSAIEYLKDIHKSFKINSQFLKFLKERKAEIALGEPLPSQFWFNVSENLVNALDQILMQEGLPSSEGWNAIAFLRKQQQLCRSPENAIRFQEMAEKLAQSLLAPEREFVEHAIEFFESTLVRSDHFRLILSVFQRRKSQILKGEKRSSYILSDQIQLMIRAVKTIVKNELFSSTEQWKIIDLLRQMEVWGDNSREQTQVRENVDQAVRKLLSSKLNFLNYSIEYMQGANSDIYRESIAFLNKEKEGISRGVRPEPHFWIRTAEKVADAVSRFLNDEGLAHSDQWGAIGFLRRLSLFVKNPEIQGKLESVANEAAHRILDVKRRLMIAAIDYMEKNPDNSIAYRDAIAFFRKKLEQITRGKQTAIPFWYHATPDHKGVRSILDCGRIFQNNAVRGYGAYVSSSDEAGQVMGYGRYTFALDSGVIHERPAAYFVPNPENTLRNWAYNRIHGWKCPSIWVRVERSIPIDSKSVAYIGYPRSEENTHVRQRAAIKKLHPWVQFMNRDTSEKICDVFRNVMLRSLPLHWRWMENIVRMPLPKHFEDRVA